jgi:hypothetical protein
MRINNIGTPLVVPSEPETQVGAVRGIGPAGQQTPGVPVRAPVTSPANQEPAPPPAPAERRATGRRAADRRKQQTPVLIDTRVSQRRRKRRRKGDAPPDSVDIDA